MYVQAIRGKTNDAGALRKAHQRWGDELAPGAKGFLGSTAGVADDGTYITVVRFESEEAAKANSDRPEQSAWWEETSKLFDGEPTFYNCPEVELFMGGGSDDAGFVQVMIYKPNDLDAMRAMTSEFEKFAGMRPDMMGGSTSITSDGTVVDTSYFTSEAEAREGEKKELPADLQETMGNFEEIAGEVTFIDLKDPWFI